MTSQFCKCPSCDKLNILGATCVCGQRTDLPFEPCGFEFGDGYTCDLPKGHQ